MKVLFVCTGNVFRSMTAEKCFNHYCLKDGLSDWRADSAGIAPFQQEILSSVKKRLSFYNIPVGEHTYKAVTATLLAANDAVIAMHHNHQTFLQEHFDLTVPLFSEVAYGTSEGLPDIDDLFPETVGQEGFRELPAAYAHTHAVVDYIYNATPFLVKNLQK